MPLLLIGWAVVGALLVGCGGADDKTDRGARSATTEPITTDSDEGPCQELPPPGPALDWLPADLPLPDGSYVVREVAVDRDHYAYRAAVFAMPLEYLELVKYTKANWRTHGWVIGHTEAERGESEGTFTRSEESLGFKARDVYCKDGWSEVALSLDRAS